MISSKDKFNIPKIGGIGVMKETEAREYYDKIFKLLKKHHEWFRSAIPLIASENPAELLGRKNIPSPAVRECLCSDFGNRYAESP